MKESQLKKIISEEVNKLVNKKPINESNIEYSGEITEIQDAISNIQDNLQMIITSYESTLNSSRGKRDANRMLNIIYEFEDAFNLFIKVNGDDWFRD